MSSRTDPNRGDAVTVLQIACGALQIPAGEPSDEELVRAVAALSIVEDGLVTYCEPFFPVVALCRALGGWLDSEAQVELHLGGSPVVDGDLLHVVPAHGGWVVGSDLADDPLTGVHPYEDVHAALVTFRGRVLRHLEMAGVDIARRDLFG